MEVESFLDLYDSCWFSLEILTRKQIPKLPFNNQNSSPKFSSLRSILIRSKSEELSSQASFNYGSPPPPPPPTFPHLKTILSGKELPAEKPQIAAAGEKGPVQETGEMRKTRQSSRRRKNRGSRSKSLSELEFEELKGFMDLGFVFSEKDKDSSLAQIIPGLQRLGENDEENGGFAEDQETGEEKEKGSPVSRAPYLSEAWEVLLMEEERRRRMRENSMILKNWRVPVPALTSEIDMKDNLRSWAHTIASAVR